jgi:hypothetical protein
MMKLLTTTAVVIGLSGCVTPIETHGIDTALAGHCKMAAYQLDQTSQQGVRHGVIGLVISQSNENTRRQEIYDACIQERGR